MSNRRTQTVTFNRRLSVLWLLESLRLAAESLPPQEVEERLKGLVASENAGKDSIQKSVRYLRQLWLEPKASTQELREEALALYRQTPTETVSKVLCWGMILAHYPFVREVSETAGRLFRLQEEVKQAQLTRKLKELFGERETVIRSSRYAINLLSDFKFILLESKKKIYTQGEILSISEPRLAAWYLKAYLISLGGLSEISREDLTGNTGLFMIKSNEVLSLALTTETFKLSRESYSRELVVLNK